MAFWIIKNLPLSTCVCVKNQTRTYAYTREDELGRFSLFFRFGKCKRAKRKKKKQINAFRVFALVFVEIIQFLLRNFTVMGIIIKRKIHFCKQNRKKISSFISFYNSSIFRTLHLFSLFFSQTFKFDIFVQIWYINSIRLEKWVAMTWVTAV